MSDEYEFGTEVEGFMKILKGEAMVMVKDETDYNVLKEVETL